MVIETKDLKREHFNKIREYFPSFDYIMYMQGVYLGGGALRTLVDHTDTIADIDLFFERAEYIEAVKQDLLEEGYEIVFECAAGHMISFKKSGPLGENMTKVQLITRSFYPTMKDLVESFDISACCAAWDGETLVTSDNWAESVEHKRGYINNVTYPVATITRISKYIAKGYWFSEETLQGYVRQVKEGKWSEDKLALYID